VADLLDTVDIEAIRRRRFRIVVDYGYSPVSLILPVVLGELDVEAIAAHAYISARTAIPPEASLQESLGQAKRLVTAVGADLGVVIDQAGERLYLVDENAHEVPVEQALLLVVSLLGRDGRTGAVALPITATNRVDELVAGSGLEVRRTRASLAALTKAAAEEGTVFAGSVTGGFVFPSFLPAYDSIATLANLLELLAPVTRPLSELVAELPVSMVVHRQVRCPWALKGAVMRVLTERLKARETDLLDGIKVFEERGWAQVLPDASEPVIHVYAEGNTKDEADALEREYRSLVEEVIASDGAPVAGG
jgi:mannose-1-phosphate guanylyltransferase/phosphomannomutase